MQVHVAFGKTGLDLNLPGSFNYQVLESVSVPPLPDTDAAIVEALNTPVASPPLAALAAGKRSVAISVCDITRPAPNRVVLPPLIRCLESAGVPKTGIRILIATGLHRGATESEIRQIVGDQ